MKKHKIIIALLLIIAISVAVWFPTKKRTVARSGIPKLPNTAEIIEWNEWSSLFTRGFQAKVKMPAEDLVRYASRFEAQRKVIGTGENEYFPILGTEYEQVKGSPNGIPSKGKMVLVNDFHKPLLAGVADIERGYIYEAEEGVDSWTAYFDTERSLVYLEYDHN